MKKYTIDDLRDIMVQLRGENGCPWDKVQTHQSIKKSMIEECYEAIDALDSGDDHAFANELGDVHFAGLCSTQELRKKEEHLTLMMW